MLPTLILLFRFVSNKGYPEQDILTCIDFDKFLQHVLLMFNKLFTTTKTKSLDMCVCDLSLLKSMFECLLNFACCDICAILLILLSFHMFVEIQALQDLCYLFHILDRK